MGLTFVKMKIRKSYESDKSIDERLLVDSGAIYTVVPQKDLESLEILPHTEEELELSDGQSIKRQVGDAYFEYNERKGSSPVVFGQEGDSHLLGVLTLEALGLMLDPLKREIKPMRKILF
jgi:predicted aspartyl protease